jgi:hypothetical protein
MSVQFALKSKFPAYSVVIVDSVGDLVQSFVNHSISLRTDFLFFRGLKLEPETWLVVPLLVSIFPFKMLFS